MAGNEALLVRSHVARDLLQNAALFKTDKLVVWEYVSNGLQYIDAGTAPRVRVTLDSKRKHISVTDNGRGMDWSGLQNFFVMHGENTDRKAGRPGRGRFGTGKSAAFGIADLLKITTVRAGKRYRVELRRGEIQGMRSEDPIPVRVLERGAKTSDGNGTRIDIEGVHLASLDQAGIISYIERHLAKWPKNATVYVNNHECEYAEPAIAFTRRFRPAGVVSKALGDIELLVKVSKSPLDQETRGISIYSNGVWHETSLAGNEGREFASHIFGEVDIPCLDTDTSPIPPFDLSRSMRLNASNPVVQILFAFLGQKIDEVRRELVTTDKERKATEEAKRLAEQASEIARVINDDFAEFRQRVAKARARASGSVDSHVGFSFQDSATDELASGGPISSDPVSDTGGPGSKGGGSRNGRNPRSLGPRLEAKPDGTNGAHPIGATSVKALSRGGFDVRFQRMGADSHRAAYVRDERTIYVNLDHPQLSAARGTDAVEDISFRRLAYEVAFAEYAVALASELAARDEYLDPTDPIVDIRETLNRLARKGAKLYASTAS